jgi:hypothetical protein
VVHLETADSRRTSEKIATSGPLRLPKA